MHGSKETIERKNLTNIGYNKVMSIYLSQSRPTNVNLLLPVYFQSALLIMFQWRSTSRAVIKVCTASSTLNANLREFSAQTSSNE